MPRPIAKPQAALLALLAFLVGPSSVAHALDPESTTPYKVKVVLRVAPHRLLTPIFKEQVRRDLQESLQAALGALGEVEVVDPAKVPADKQPQLWKDVEAKGLDKGLDGPSKGTSDTKTHFVDIDYVDGQYDIKARQYDGSTGLASPAVRHERTPDRQFVARTAALLVDQDFGAVGTVTDGGDGQTVRVAFKGGGLKLPLNRGVKKGDVFALVQVTDGGGAVRVPWTVLRAEGAPGEDGTCVCKLLPPRKQALTAAGGGFRCLKLGTIKAPLRLRVVQAGTGRVQPPPDTLGIEVRRDSFADTRPDKGYTDGDGFVVMSDKKDTPYDGLALVTVLQGGQARSVAAVPLVDQRTVVLPVRLGAEVPESVERRSIWEEKLLDEQLLLDSLVKDLNADIAKPDRRATALERARKALEGLTQRLGGYASTREELAALKPPAGAKALDLSKGDARLKDVQEGRRQLAAFITNLEEALKKGGADQEARTAYEQAHLLENAGEYDKAIALYEKVLAATKDPKLEERLKKLKDAWQTKGDDHAKARAFIYETWPKLESPAVMKERVKQAQDALKVCRSVKDPLGPRRLLAAALEHSRKLSKQLEALSPDANEEDRKPAEELTEVLDKLATLIKDAKAAVADTPAP